MSIGDPIEALLSCVADHVGRLRGLADSLEQGDMARTALALDASADDLEAAVSRAREHLALGDTAVLSIADLDEGP